MTLTLLHRRICRRIEIFILGAIEVVQDADVYNDSDNCKRRCVQGSSLVEGGGHGK